MTNGNPYLLAVAASFFLLATAAAATDGGNFSVAKRRAYLEQAIRSVAASKALARSVHAFVASEERSKCRSVYPSLAVSCFREEVARFCASQPQAARKDCSPISDLAVVNQLNEDQFMSREERVKLAQEAKEYAEAYELELKRKHGLLAMDFLISARASCDGALDKGASCLARAIDDYCLKTADTRSLPWQGCAAALAWFIETEG